MSETTPAVAPGPITVPCGAATYTLRRPGAYERQVLRGEASRLGARRHGPFAQLEALRRALAELLPGEEDAATLASLSATIDGYLRQILLLAAAHRTRTPVARLVRLNDELRALEHPLLRAADIVRRAETPAARDYQAMLADDTIYGGLYGLAAARHLLDRVECGGAAVWAGRHPGMTTPDSVLDGIPDGDYDAIATAVLAVVEPAPRPAGAPAPQAGPPADNRRKRRAAASQRRRSDTTAMPE